MKEKDTSFKYEIWDVVWDEYSWKHGNQSIVVYRWHKDGKNYYILDSHIKEIPYYVSWTWENELMNKEEYLNRSAKVAKKNAELKLQEYNALIEKYNIFQKQLDELNWVL